ncbi:uncharacterized protein PAC_17850 [Phialocephala subalpina]|uniref:Uncharacterized protein n=1 Tax=Phialocephala subalpina TaxID=576137 RepID=A0A1L7XSC4_9HELO|nr:uncharacterized protein PAC_17850 [Phialocephala subalpina]
MPRFPPSTVNMENYCLFAFLLLCIASPVRSGDNYLSLRQAFPLLNGLDRPPSRLSLRYGGQNFTRCCLMAFEQALTVENGAVAPSTHASFLDGEDKSPVNITDLLESQFPCSAAYQGDRKGVNQLKVPWWWCNDNCPGFEISRSSKLNQWIQPFVGFVLPSVIFCLTIPRRRKLRLPDKVFPRDIDNINIFKAFISVGAAAFVVSTDTILWLGTVFALAGRLLLSGVYEAFIDKRVVDFMDEKIRNGCLPPSLRARILFTVLVGNLDLESAWKPSMDLANPLEAPGTTHQTPVSRTPPRTPSIPSQQPSSNSPTQTPQSGPSNGECEHTPPATSPTTLQPLTILPSDVSVPSQLIYERVIRQEPTQNVQLRLKSMLACQNSFGSYVGAPVIFYLGSFVFALLEINATLGENDVAHALAFGAWWMTIPHISIVSGCLLAGNNPNTLEAIAPNGMSRRRSSWKPPLNAPKGFWAQLGWRYQKVAYRLFEPTYEAEYYPAPMWERGRSKRKWVMRLVEKYRNVAPRDMEDLQSKLLMAWGDWFLISVLSTVLLSVPCVLGLLISYFTPQVGLACRSMTFLVYVCSEVLLLLLWIWDLATKVERPRPGVAEPCGGNTPGERTEVREISTSYLSILSSVIFWILTTMGLFGATFSAIGGTMMQIIGVYRNCLCKISVGHWKDKNMTLFLSTNNRMDIEEALHWWLMTGAVATGFLGVICYIGWWYQRRLRFRFRGLVDKLNYRFPWPEASGQSRND